MHGPEGRLAIMSVASWERKFQNIKHLLATCH
nr:hypothetical protein [Mesorhizobium sp.]